MGLARLNPFFDRKDNRKCGTRPSLLVTVTVLFKVAFATVYRYDVPNDRESQSGPAATLAIFGDPLPKWIARQSVIDRQAVVLNFQDRVSIFNRDAHREARL